MRNLEFLSKQPVHRFNIVAHGGQRETWPVQRLRRVARRRGASVAKHLSSHQEQFGRIERPLRANQPLVAVKSSHVVRWKQHHVVPGGIEMSISSINHACLWQGDSTFGFEVRNHELMLFPLFDFWSGCGLCYERL